MTDGPLEHVAAELRARQRTVHERVACPKCRAYVGERCVRVVQTMSNGVAVQSRPPLKHSHVERLEADGMRLR